MAQGGRRLGTRDAKDPFIEMAKAYGLGKKTGLDLPGEVGGRIFDREGKYDYWQAIRERRLQGCPDAAAERGRPPAASTRRTAAQGYIYQRR